MASTFAPDVVGWVYTDTDDAKEYFDANLRLTSVVKRGGFTESLLYNTQNNLASVTDSFGRQLTFGYDSFNRVATISDAVGNLYEYGYDAIGNLVSVKYPDSNDVPNNPATRIDNPVRQYGYEDPNYKNALTKLTDENGAVYATWTYDAVTGKATSSQHAGGAEHTDLSYAATYTTITDAAGKQRTFNTAVEYGVGVITAVTGANCNICGGAAATTSYGANGLKNLVADYNGNTTAYTYEFRRLVTQKIEGSGTDQRTTKTTWNATLRLPELVTVEIGNGTGQELQRTSNTYLNGQIKTRTEHDSRPGSTDPDRVTTYTYYGETAGDNPVLSGLLKSIDGPRTDGVADITTFAYDSTTGNVAGITNALGQLTQFSNWDGRGTPRTVIDPNGAVTTLNFDPSGRILSRTVAGLLTSWAYDKAGLLKVMTLPDGTFLSYTYDNAHRLTDTLDNLGNKIHYTVDALGNRTKEEVRDPGNALRREIDRSYNSLNQLQSLTRSVTTPGVGLVTIFQYDGNGNPTRMIDPRDPAPANPTILEEKFYDSLNRLRQVKDNSGGVATTTYDVHDQPTSVTDPRQLVTAYTLNGFGERRSENSPDAGTTYFQYDRAGNRTQVKYQKVAGTDIIVNYKYDALNRVTRIDYPPNDPTVAGANDIIYTYDENASGQNGVGRLTTVTDESGVWTYRYDLQGNVKHVGVNFSKIGGGTFSLDYDYDAADRLQRITYPSGRHVTFVRTGGLVTSATTDTGGAPTNLATLVTHAPFGPITSFKYGDAGLTPFTRNLDADYRVRGITHGTMLDLQYSYVDPITTRMTENVTAITDLLAATKTQTFTFDLLNRVLTGSSTAYGTQTFASVADPYDPVGNRSKTVTGASTQLYSYEAGSNRLLNVSGGGPSFSYNLAGNATSRGPLKFAYGDDQRLKAVNDYDLPAASGYIYNHNYLGQRVRKKIDAQLLFFMYGLDGELLAEIDGATGTISKEYGYLEGIPIALFTPDNPLDTDGDGLPNAWETQYGLNPNNAADASSNSDGDKLTALQEYQMGTDPTKADTDGDGIQDDSDPQPTELNSAWQIPIQRELLH